MVFNDDLKIVTLDSTCSSELNWSVSRKEALLFIAQGKKLLWHLDFGLFSRLANPLNHSGQFMTLGLAIDHFTHFWQDFQSYSLGVCLFRGSPHFFEGFFWDENQIQNFQLWLEEGMGSLETLFSETGVKVPSFSQIKPENFQSPYLSALFCQDVCCDYLTQLSNRLPDAIPRYLLFEGDKTISPLFFSLLTSKERLEGFEICLNEPPYQEDRSASTAICLPSISLRRPSHYRILEKAFSFLIKNRIPFKVIPESHLTSEWDGLDTLLYAPSALTFSGQRKFHGFNAANGTLVSMEEKRGFEIEITFEEYQRISLPNNT